MIDKSGGGGALSLKVTVASSGVGGIAILNAGPMGTEEAVIDPVYSCKSVRSWSPTVIEALKAIIVDSRAFINQGYLLFL